MIGMFGIELSLELIKSFIDKGSSLTIQFVKDDGTLGNVSDVTPLSIMSVRGRTYLRTKDRNKNDLLVELKRIVSVHPVKGYGDADTKL